jgi:hypothetical protein
MGTTLPITVPTIIDTREVGDAARQIVEPSGRFFGAADDSGTIPLDPAGYTPAGRPKAITDGFDAPISLGPGVYRVRRASVVLGPNDLAPVLALVVTPFDSGAPPTFPADGEDYTAPHVFGAFLAATVDGFDSTQGPSVAASDAILIVMDQDQVHIAPVVTGPTGLLGDGGLYAVVVFERIGDIEPS